MRKHRKKINDDNQRIKNDRRTLYKRIFYTIGVLIIYHFLGYVTIPGVNSKAMLAASQNEGLAVLSMFSGGNFQSFSIMSMGVTAYVSAQIVVQLLQANVVPKLTEWSKQGQTGREKLNQLIRVLTLIFSFVQALGITAGINSITGYDMLVDSSWQGYLLICTLLTAGTFAAMWMGDLITENGLGNGVSVIISTGIIAQWPQLTDKFIKAITKHHQLNWKILIATIIGLIVMITFIVWFNQSERRLPIQYARRETLTGNESFLPLKINVPGVVPVIFAGSIIAIPQTLLMLFEDQSTKTWYKVLANFFTLNTSTGIIIYGVLITIFTYIYSSIQLDPEKLADNFTKQEAYIPSVYPGNPTAIYIQNTLNYLAFPGSLFLVVISVVPLIVSKNEAFGLQLGITGSSLLIVVGVILEIGRQINGLRNKNDYAGFLSTKYEFTR